MHWWSNPTANDIYSIQAWGLFAVCCGHISLCSSSSGSQRADNISSSRRLYIIIISDPCPLTRTEEQSQRNINLSWKRPCPSFPTWLSRSCFFLIVHNFLITMNSHIYAKLKYFKRPKFRYWQTLADKTKFWCSRLNKNVLYNT